MLGRPHRILLAVVAVALVLAGCGGSSGTTKLGARPSRTTTGSDTTTTVPPYVSYIVTAKPTVTHVLVFASPKAKTSMLDLPNPWLVDPKDPSTGVPQVFLLKQRADGWVQVLLPVRPNGSAGWVRTSDLTITPNVFDIKISLGAHTILVTHGTTVVYTGPVAVGATDPPLPDAGKPTPTPTGRYYLRVLLQAPDPNTVYGPFAYGLSSHSDTLDQFAGADAEIGIHGNNDASVLGKSVTHGCVRMDNAAITALSKQLPLGTPVEIAA